MASKEEKVLSSAISLLKAVPEGIRYMDLVRKVQKQFPDIPEKSIEFFIWDIDNKCPKDVYKHSKGLYRHIKFKDKTDEVVPLIKEKDLYPFFVDHLKNLGECIEATDLGGNIFKDKWGTPDVIGVYKSRGSDRFKQPIEIVSAEIKADTDELITAFGQACAYKVFSHKVYLVIPKNSQQNDLDRLDSLCMICGIGLILFDTNTADEPQFDIRVRATKHEPDTHFLNKYMDLLPKEKLDHLLS